MRRLVVSGVALFLLVGCGGGSSDPDSTATTTVPTSTPATPPKSTAPATTTIFGDVVAPVDITSVINAKDPTLGVTECTADTNYSDIAEGAQVTVKDSTGKIVGLAKLGPGVLAGKSGVMMFEADCKFGFRVDDVPAGGQFYSIEAAHRGEVNFTADEIAADQVRIDVGK